MNGSEVKMSKVLLSGDEAVARGAWEAGVSVAAAYPGTPSTEILENMAQYKDDVYATWANNEKIATEIAIGASIGGLRAFAAMKHVGMNVATDPMFTVAYTGVNGGLMLVTADDPGAHSSQNEQDNRLYAPHARMAMLEPSDSQECLDFTKAAFDISEKFDLVVELRMTTRVCHSKSIVELGPRQNVPPKKYESNPAKFSMLPAHARVRHYKVEENLRALAEYSETSPLNKVEHAGSKLGIVASGINYMHAHEAFGEGVGYLKLGITYPIAENLVRDFCSNYDEIIVIEEGEPYLENTLKAMGIKCHGKAELGPQGELSASRIREAFGLPGENDTYESPAQAPNRPPVLCAGCPHRGFYYSLRKHKDKLVAVGDIGYYALGASAPFFGFDAGICMGSGFSIPIGLSLALKAQGDTRKAFGILGDSTFFHSGFNSLVDAVHQQADVCLVLLDNSITAMTGHQENAGTEISLMGYEVPAISIDKMVAATGLAPERVRVVDPIDQKAMDEAIEAALATEGTFVIITRRPCALLREVIKARAGRHCEIDADKCRGCKACMRVACPAMKFADGKAEIVDIANCTACGLCAQMCKFGAINVVGGAK